MKPLIIFGSSNNKGNTRKAIDLVLNGKEAQIINLNDLNISIFDYEYKNKEDDFLSLAKKITKANPIILATPVYWYGPSSIMKIFIDRISDLLIHEKEVGRKLKGKDLYIISSYHIHPEGKEGFENIFSQICQYLGINYKGCYFYYCGDSKTLSESNISRAEEFSHKIFL